MCSSLMPAQWPPELTAQCDAGIGDNLGIYDSLSLMAVGCVVSYMCRTSLHDNRASLL